MLRQGGGVNVLTWNPAKIDDFAAPAPSDAKGVHRDFLDDGAVELSADRFNGGFQAIDQWVR